MLKTHLSDRMTPQLQPTTPAVTQVTRCPMRRLSAGHFLHSRDPPTTLTDDFAVPQRQEQQILLLRWVLVPFIYLICRFGGSNTNPRKAFGTVEAPQGRGGGYRGV